MKIVRSVTTGDISKRERQRVEENTNLINKSVPSWLGGETVPVILREMRNWQFKSNATEREFVQRLFLPLIFRERRRANEEERREEERREERKEEQTYHDR